MIFLVIVRRIHERQLRAHRQRPLFSAELNALVKRPHVAAACQVRIPAILRLLGIRLVVCPGKIARHSLAAANEHVLVVLGAVVATVEVRALGIRCRKVDLEHALDDDGHHDPVALTGLGKGDGEQVEAALAVIPVGVSTDRQRRAAALNVERPVGNIGLLYKDTVLELEHVDRCRNVRSSCVQAQRIRITTVGNDVEIVLNGIRVVARKNKDVGVGIRLCGIRVIVCIELTGT